MSYILHYAPDNASLCIRLALEHIGVPYETALVNRKMRAQDSPAYRALNPNALIPVLETQQGAIFETGAILLWLADTHGGLGPQPGDADRGAFLKWLFFAANTIHPAERMIFYPDKFIGPSKTDQDALRKGLQAQLCTSLTTLDSVAANRPNWLGAENPTALDFYLAPLLRWPALYPAKTDRSWFELRRFPALFALAERLEALPCTHAAQKAEGLGPTPFTNPSPVSPPEGSAT